jgi:hypothetical protein
VKDSEEDLASLIISRVPFDLSLGTFRIVITLLSKTYLLNTENYVVRECLNNIDDIAGLWQVEGGRVLENQKIGRELFECETRQLWDARTEYRHVVGDFSEKNPRPHQFARGRNHSPFPELSPITHSTRPDACLYRARRDAQGRPFTSRLTPP